MLDPTDINYRDFSGVSPDEFVSNGDRESMAYRIKSLKLEIEKAENRLKEAVSAAFTRSSDVARSTFGIPASKVTSSMMEQITNNDAEVKEARRLILRLKEDLLIEESAAETSTPKSQAEVSTSVLNKISIPYIQLGDDAEGEGNALEIYQAISDEVRQIAENVKQLSRSINSRPPEWNRDFWESEILENATIYKVDLTDYAEIIRSVLRHVADKSTQVELRYFISYINSLRDDCRSMMDLAKIQSRGF